MFNFQRINLQDFMAKKHKIGATQRHDW